VRFWTPREADETVAAAAAGRVEPWSVEWIPLSVNTGPRAG
jgi:hypothetical protein